MGLPSRHLTFVVSFDAPLELAVLPDGSEGASAFDALLGGLHTSPAVIRHDGSQHGIQLQVTPAGARGLFGLPAGEVAARGRPARRRLGTARRRAARSACRGGRTGRDRFAVLDGVLLRALVDPGRAPVRRPPRDDGGVGAADASAGRVGVATLAGEVGWSRRHLTERSPPSTASAPRSLARVLRFERARSAARPARSPDARRRRGDVRLRRPGAHGPRLARPRRRRARPRWLESEVLPFVQDEDAARRRQSESS